MKVLILMILSINTFAQQKPTVKEAKKTKQHKTVLPKKVRKIPLFY
jgi:hypothetical protein